jgi:hypothetical protein
MAQGPTERATQMTFIWWTLLKLCISSLLCWLILCQGCFTALYKKQQCILLVYTAFCCMLQRQQWWVFNNITPVTWKYSVSYIIIRG